MKTWIRTACFIVVVALTTAVAACVLYYAVTGRPDRVATRREAVAQTAQSDLIGVTVRAGAPTDTIGIEHLVPSVDKVYDASPVTLACRITVGSDVRSLSYAWYRDDVPVGDDSGKHTVCSVADSGTYRLEVTAKMTDGSARTQLSDPVTVAIAKARYDMSAVRFEDKRIVCDGNAHMLTAVGVPRGVQVGYTAPVTEVGAYTVTATFVGDTLNYHPIPAMSATLTICAPTLTYTLGDGTVLTARNANGFLPGCRLATENALQDTQTHLQSLLGGSRALRSAMRVVLYDADGARTPFEPNTTISWRRAQGVDWSQAVFGYSDGDTLLQSHAASGDEWTIAAGDGYYLFAVRQTDVGRWVPIGLLIILLAQLLAIGLTDAAIRRRSGNRRRAVPAFSAIGALWTRFTLAQQVWVVLLGAAIALATVVLISKLTRLMRLLRVPQQEAHAAQPALPMPQQMRSRNDMPSILALEAALDDLSAPLPAPPAQPETPLPAVAPVVPDPIAPEPVVWANAPSDPPVAEAQSETDLRYRYSAQARLIQADAQTQRRFGALRDALLGYRGVKMRMSWEYARFYVGHQTLALAFVRGKSVVACFALDPAQAEDSKYRPTDVSEQGKYALTPLMLKIRSDGALRYACKLADMLAQRHGLESQPYAARPYLLAYESKQELLRRGLVKCILTGRIGGCKQTLDLGKLLRPRIDRAQADKALDDTLAQLLTERETDASGADGRTGAVYLDTLSQAFAAHETVDVQALVRKKLLPEDVTRIRVLGRGVVDKPLVVKAGEFSPEAVKMLVLTGGSAVKLCG